MRKKNGFTERERERERIDYLNKRGDKIDELMWIFCKSECVK